MALKQITFDLNQFKLFNTFRILRLSSKNIALNFEITTSSLVRSCEMQALRSTNQWPNFLCSV